MDTFLKAVIECSHPNASWNLEGESKYSNFTWLSEEYEKPSEATVLAKKAELDSAEPIRKIRMKRNKLLLETDKYMIIDFPLSDIQRISIKNYRQALRDLPMTSAEALSRGEEVIFPEYPL